MRWRQLSAWYYGDQKFPDYKDRVSEMLDHWDTESVHNEHLLAPVVPGITFRISLPGELLELNVVELIMEVPMDES